VGDDSSMARIEHGGRAGIERGVDGEDAHLTLAGSTAAHSLWIWLTSRAMPLRRLRYGAAGRTSITSGR
jgi:hypothetical protein